ncbi:MAG: hypothetical protein P0Y66_22355 [Candidatus Kaistia colombiensis]|nr:MAG: hypothetical protein P0Y66_22355 [Kaistia sp.]
MIKRLKSMEGDPASFSDWGKAMSANDKPCERVAAKVVSFQRTSASDRQDGFGHGMKICFETESRVVELALDPYNVEILRLATGGRDPLGSG